MRWLKIPFVLSLLVAMVGCGAFRGNGPSEFNENLIGGNPSDPDVSNETTIWDAFGRSDSEQTISVNRYLWNASLDVLSFLPVQSVDPFTGVIITGYGTPPGGGRAYRATVHINDPALDVRSLKVSLQSKSGPVSASTARAVEDAILARARQFRIADKRL